ncbi:MAG: hypothetical protein U0414_32865 [Polyangiaceae bacterium]
MRPASLLLLTALIAGCSNTSHQASASGDSSSTGASAGATTGAGGDHAATCPEVVGVPPSDEVLVAGDPGATLGIFDPSIVYPARAPGGVMAYSAVPTQETIVTRIALSSDHGDTWTFVAQPNVAEPATIPSSDAKNCPGGQCSGHLISEVSSLVLDASDPDPGARWKLFAHRYLVGPGVALHYDIGTIALQTAPNPEGPWSPPKKLLGWSSASPYSSTDVAVNVSKLAGMSDCVALTEPGALALPGEIDLAVGCAYIEGGAPKIRVELLRSTDHAASWAHVSTLLTPADAACLTSGASINAADLFESQGRVYVSATPSDATGYHGCAIFEMADFAAGTVRRDAAGKARVPLALAAAPDRFAGACAHAEGARGFSMITGFFGDTRPFRIVRTGIAGPPL